MKNPVILKSYKDGIAVYLNDELPFEELLLHVEEKFRDSARFFGDMRVAVSFEGRDLSGEEENALIDAVTRCSRLNVICVVGKNRERQGQFQETMEAFERYFPKAGNEGQFYRGSLKNGQILETEGSVVVLGDVEEGCCVMAAKDIIVLGRLDGSAYAGGDGLNHHFIAALEMTPQKLKIGDFKYKAKEKSRWHLKARRMQPLMACVRSGEIQMQSITNELLNELPL